MSNTTSNKDIVARLYAEGFNGGDEQVYLEVYTDDFRHHSKVVHDLPAGAEGERLSMLQFRATLPDVHFEVLGLLADGDSVVARLRITGTPIADFGTVLLAADGRFDVHALALFRLRDGLIAEEWFFVDSFDSGT